MTDDPYRYFRVEARELLEGLVEGVLELERGTRPRQTVAGLLRLAHTLKGAARVVRQPEIAERSHAVEEALEPYRETPDRLPQPTADALFELLDGVRDLILALPPPAGADHAAADDRSPPAGSTRTIRTELLEMDALLDGITEVHVKVNGLRSGLSDVALTRHLADLLVGSLGSPDTGERTAGERDRCESAGPAARVVAIELRAAIDSLARDLGDGTEGIDRDLRDLRDAVERLRLAPARTLFVELDRAARDVAQAQRKQVVFEGQGGDIRLDADVLEAATTALAQLVRNAVAHGIEPPSERVQAGKPEHGRVTVEVAARGRWAVFTCRDDGRGIDLEAVRAAAHRKGVLGQRLDDLGAEELMRLLLRGGISTSTAVTEVSGRGVGLDVAVAAAARAGGDVEVTTERAVGTSIELKLPLALASFDALSLEADGLRALLPLEAVRETRRVDPERIISDAGGRSLAFDGTVVPFLDLPAVLAGAPVTGDDDGVWSVALVGGADGLAAVGARRIAGVSSIVMRPMPDSAAAPATVSGVWLDTDGNPQLVLDPDGLVAEARRATDQVPAPEKPRPAVLVVDDSLTTRMLEQSILETAGYDVDVACSGEEALTKARERRYRLLLVDVEMPGMDGYTLIERTKSDPALRDIPCVLITSRASAEDRQRGTDVGASDYMAKSEFDQGRLLARVRELTGEPSGAGG